MSNVTRLDELASRFVTGEIDLSGYYEEDIKPRVKNATEYRDEVNAKLLNGQDDGGCPLPWAGFAGRFVLRPSELTIWSGYKGHGKSALISQVMNMAMCRRQKVFIVSPEFRPVMVILRLMYQKIQTRSITAELAEEWFRWAQFHLWLYDVQASLKPDDVVALCRYVVDKLDVDHILIDSLMKCGIATDDYNSQKKLVDRVQSVAHNSKTHIHLVAHAKKGSSDELIPKLHDIKGASEIADLAENVFVVWRNKPKEKDPEKHEGKPDCVAVVESQRNADGWIGIVPLMYEKNTFTFSMPSQFNNGCPI